MTTFERERKEEKGRICALKRPGYGGKMEKNTSLQLPDPGVMQCLNFPQYVKKKKKKKSLNPVDAYQILA